MADLSELQKQAYKRFNIRLMTVLLVICIVIVVVC
jgi:uncharacterized membrane protein